MQSGHEFGHRGVGDQQLDPGIGHNIIHLVGFEEIVDRRDHRSGVHDPKQSGNKGRTILQPKTDAISRFDAMIIPQMPGHLDGLRPQLRVGKLGVAVINRNLFPIFQCGSGEGARQIHAPSINLKHKVQRRKFLAWIFARFLRSPPLLGRGILIAPSGGLGIARHLK